MRILHEVEFQLVKSSKACRKRLRSSKMVQFSVCLNDMGPKEAAQILVRDVFRLQEGPQFLMSDREKLQNQQTTQHDDPYHGVPRVVNSSLVNGACSSVLSEGNDHMEQHAPMNNE